MKLQKGVAVVTAGLSPCGPVATVSDGYLCKQVLHLGLLGPEALDLLVNSRIFLELVQRGPFTVQVRTRRHKPTMK